MRKRITHYVETKCLYGTTDTLPPAPGVMQVFYDDTMEVPQMVDFRCPCGCGATCPTHVVSMAEKKDTNHKNHGVWKNACWGFDKTTLTLFPSIRFTSGCKAHFNIENGKVIFHSDSGM